MTDVAALYALNQDAIAMLQDGHATSEAVAVYLDLLSRLSDLQRQPEPEVLSQQGNVVIISVDASVADPNADTNSSLGIFNRAFCLVSATSVSTMDNQESNNTEPVGSDAVTVQADVSDPTTVVFPSAVASTGGISAIDDSAGSSTNDTNTTGLASAFTGALRNTSHTTVEAGAEIDTNTSTVTTTATTDDTIFTSAATLTDTTDNVEASHNSAVDVSTMLSLVVMYNTSLSIHRLGLETNDYSYLGKALKLYKRVVSVVMNMVDQQRAKDTDADTLSDTGFTPSSILIMLAATMNQAQIYMECHHDPILTKQTQLFFIRIVRLFCSDILMPMTRDDNTPTAGRFSNFMDAEEKSIIYQECYRILAVQDCAAGAA